MFLRDCRYGEYCNSGKQCVRQLRDANRSVLLVLMVVMMASNTRYGSGGTNGPSLAFGGGQVRLW